MSDYPGTKVPVPPVRNSSATVTGPSSVSLVLELKLRGRMATGDSTVPRGVRACVRANPSKSPSFKRLFCSPVEAQSTSQAQVYRCPRRGGHFSSTQGLEIDMEKQQIPWRQGKSKGSELLIQSALCGASGKRSPAALFVRGSVVNRQCSR